MPDGHHDAAAATGRPLFINGDKTAWGLCLGFIPSSTTTEGTPSFTKGAPVGVKLAKL